MAVTSVTSAPGWSAVAAPVKKVTRATAPTAAPGWSAAVAPQSSYVGPTTATAAAPSSTYNMNVPGQSEGLYGAIAPVLAQPGYSEAYAGLPAYQSAQASTATNQLLNNYGAQVAQPTAFEKFATGTPAPSGNLYDVIAQNQGQVTGTSGISRLAQSGPSTAAGQNAYANSVGQVQGLNDILAFGQAGQTDADQGTRALEYSAGYVTDPTRIGAFLGNSGAYKNASNEGYSDNVMRDSAGMVEGNTLGKYVAATPLSYKDASRMTAAEREMYDAGQAMASGVDTTTASGRYWDSLQQNPTALPDANLDAYYDRQREKAQAGIDRAMAARGLFGSSASYDASREMLRDLAAEQVKAESDYSLAAALARNDISSSAARGADEAGLSRYTARNEAARGVDSAALGLSRLGLDARTANDENTLGRYVAMNNAANNVDKIANDLYLGRGDLANRSDLTDAARFSAYNQAADAVDRTDVAGYNARASALDAGGRLDVARFAANNAAAQGLDQSAIGAYNAQAGALSDAGQLDVNRFLANTGATNNADETSLNRYIAQSNTLNNAANTGIDRYRALTEGATAADAASRSLYETGSNVARTADQSANDRLNTLISSAGQADLSRTGRAQIANDAQYNYTSLLDSVLNSGYGGLIQSDEELLSLMSQLGLGASGANYQGALGNQGAVGAQGANIQQIGAQADAVNRQILLRNAGG